MAIREFTRGNDAVVVSALIPLNPRVLSAHPFALTSATFCAGVIGQVSRLAQIFLCPLSQEILEKESVPCIASVDCLCPGNQPNDEIDGYVDHHVQLYRRWEATFNLAAFSED